MLDQVKKGYIGNARQLFGVRRVIADEGRASGTHIIEVNTAGGLCLDVLPDAGLDLGQARFCGVNMSWMSKNGYDSPAAISSHETEFVNTFPGGLLYTCGLRSAGPANRDGDEWHPLHGRYHSLQAEEVCAETEGDVMVIRGRVRESALFGHCLELRRKITIPCFGASVTIEDELPNLSPRPEEYMQIYHCNFGYPMLSEKAYLELPQERETIPRTEWARGGLAKALTFEQPVDGEEERVFFHKMKSDFSAKLINPSLGMSMKMTWSGDTLPILSQWRSMASGDYVLGLEPTNSYIMGRSSERKNGTLPVLGAFETIKNTVKIEFLAE